MNILIAIASATLTALAFMCAFSTFKIARSSRANYDSNKKITADLASAALGKVADIECSRAGYPVDHFVVPFLDEEGKVIKWESAGSLSREAIDGVLVRPS